MKPTMLPIVSSLYDQELPPDVAFWAQRADKCDHAPFLWGPCLDCSRDLSIVQWGELQAAARKFRLRWRYRKDIWKMKKPAGPTPGTTWVAHDEDFAAEYPALHEHLTVDKWEDGTPRETSTLLLFVEGHLFKACINDRSLGMAAFVTGESIKALLTALDADLRQERVNWRPTRTGGRK